MTILKFGTWAPDISNVNGDTSQTAQNVLPRVDGYGPVKAPGAFSGPIVAGNDSTTRILLHLDSTTFTDVASGVTPATWAAASTAVTSVNSTTVKYGIGSLQLGGVASSYIDTASNANFAVGSSDFTIDFWARPTASNTNINILGQTNSLASTASTSFYLQRVGSITKFAVAASVSTFSTTGSTAMDSTAWTHIAGQRQSGFLYLFMNGALVNSAASAPGTTPTTPSRFAVGRIGEVTTSTYSGFLDEVRLTVGRALYPVSSTTAPGTAVFNVPPAAYGPLPSGVCRGFYRAINTDGSVTVFAGTLNRLWKLDNTSLGWVDVSKSLGSGYTDLQNSFNWQFVQYGNFVFAVQPGTAPQKFTLGSSTQFSDMSADANLPQAAYIAVIGTFLVLTGLTANPFRATWSDTPTGATGWTAGGSVIFGSQDFPNGGIARGVAGGEFGILFQDANIRRMVLTGNTTSPFQFNVLAEDLGLLAPYSIIRAGPTIFFLSNKGFYSIVGTELPVPIGIGKFDRTFFLDYDNAQLQLIIGANDPESQRVLWAYKSGAGQQGLFDKIIAYDIVLQKGTIITGLAGEYLGSLATPGFTLDNLSLVYPNLDTMPFSLDNVALAALPKAALFDSTHTLSLFTGANLEAVIETPEVVLDPQQRVRVRGARPDTDAVGALISIGAREHQQQAVAYSGEQAVDSTTGRSPQNVSTRLARGRMRIVAGTSWTYAGGMEPDFVPVGKR